MTYPTPEYAEMIPPLKTGILKLSSQAGTGHAQILNLTQCIGTPHFVEKLIVFMEHAGILNEE